MRKKIFRLLILAAVLYGGYSIFINYCYGFEVSDFHSLNNLNDKNKSITVDLTDAVHDGIVLPSVKQLPGGKFSFSFKLKNKNFLSTKYYYKIYYQDESYKLCEYEVKNGFKYENNLATRNFYGSWGETDPGFKETSALGFQQEATITDSFSIVGNPRNEEIYFGEDDHSGLSSVKIANMVNYIRSQPGWMKGMDRKSKENGCSVEQQVFRDAVWQIQNARKFQKINQRWKRNPRMGNYKFMLVVTTESGLKEIPVSVKNITQREADGRFINPFYYFLYGEGGIDKALSVSVAKEELNVKAKLQPGRGVYVSPFEFSQSGIDTISYCPTCGMDSLLFRDAQFSQYFYNEDRSHIMPTIPLAYDVVKDNYTREMYDVNKGKYSGDPVYFHYGDHSKELLQDFIHGSRRPCETVQADPQHDFISLMNPGNTEMPYRKENVGVRSRIGFTYGKVDVCVKFPELLSADHVWDGLTNAVWMLNQEEAEWNNRGGCDGGYIPRNDMRKEKAERKDLQSYSEIDFEMVKSSKNWPATSYGQNAQPEDDYIGVTDNIAVACTNWDLACRQPKKFVTGVMPFTWNDMNFDLHRWDSWYQALTIKDAENDNELFQRPFYWYEFEWTPDHIIWKIGPDKEHLRPIAYMDNTVTVVPDNQMVVVVSQEFHDSEWWVPAPYDQRYIPYPKDPLVGKIIAVEVE
ncbi:MAG: hypothetical protein HY064_10980 [Bacteroidetes bacterium]|nr:hypothetical protein [Bacteroidota bacterium]